MMSECTPGPWEIGPQGYVGIKANDPRNWEGVCQVLGWGSQHEANARLIAAAPELLAIAELVDDVSDRIDHDPDSAFGQLVAKARAAIAKATGAA